jgi:hypothetical protein
MCDCTASIKQRYCGRPGCRSPEQVAIDNFRQTAEENARRQAEVGGDERREPDHFGDVP